MTNFCLDLKSNNLDEIFIEIYSNLNLYGSFLIDSLNKYSNLNKKFNCLTNKLMFNFLTKYFSDENEIKFDEKIFVNLVKQLENSLEQFNGQQGFLEFYDSKENLLLTLLKTSSSDKSTKSYLIQLASLFNRLFRLNFTSTNKTLTQVLSQINVISSQDQESLQKWLGKILDNQEFNLNDKFTLQQFVIYLCSEAQINESVCLTVLNNLIQLSNKLITENSNNSFPGLLCLMDTLSSSGSGLGHLYLFKACIIWIEFYSTTSLNDSKTT